MLFQKSGSFLGVRTEQRDVPIAAYFAPVAMRVKGAKWAVSEAMEGEASVSGGNIPLICSLLDPILDRLVTKQLFKAVFGEAVIDRNRVLSVKTREAQLIAWNMGGFYKIVNGQIPEAIQSQEFLYLTDRLLCCD